MIKKISQIFAQPRIRFLLIFAIFFLAIIVRLYLVAYPGHFSDINFFQEWARSISRLGILNAYELRVNPEIMLPNYFPPYLYILGLIGSVYQKFFSPIFELNTYSLYFLLKLPAIIFDLLTGLLIFWLLRRQMKLKFWLASLILIFYLFNPGLIYNSAYWGQVDSIHTFFILVALFFATKNKFSFSWIFLAVALLFKLQSIIFFPLLFYFNWQKEKFTHLLKNIGLSLLTALIICLPFVLTGKFFQVAKIPFLLSERYPFLSVNAFNFWWLYAPFVFSDLEKFLGLVPYFLVGFALFFFVYLFAIKNLLKNPSEKMIYLTAAFLVLIFFMLSTRMHERYLYSLFPLMVLVLNKDKKLWLIYFFLSLTHFVNLVALAPIFNSQSFINLSIFSSWPFVFLNILCFFYFLYYLLVFANKKQTKVNKMQI